MIELVGKKKIREVLSDEILLISYEYNTQQPRFYSKYFTDQDKGTYDVLVSDATGASSAAPIYFQPKTYNDGYSFKNTLIDGGLAANNPALYAFFLK